MPHLSRDSWIFAFVDVLVAAGRPKKMALQVAHSEWATRSAENPEKIAREWLRKQGKT
jgi:hypothetical protein